MSSEKPKTIRELRFGVLHSAYKLAFGHADEQKQALESLAHLIFVLQQETTKEK